MADEFVWMFHEDTGNHAQFPVGAVQYWTARGWTPSDPPAEIDPTRAHLANAPDAAVVPAPAPKPAKTTKAAKAAEAAATTEEGVE